MKKQNWLINLSIIGLLWFSLGFACNSGNDRSGRTTSYDDDETAAQSTSQNADDTERRSVKTGTGVGKPYGARDPETCQATGGSRVPSEEEAIEAFRCHYEGEASNQLILAEDVSIQIGRAHPYNPRFGEFEPNIDTKYLIYPIRGSYKQYKCRPITDNAGENCWINDHSNAEGECYKTEWGEWHCMMLDGNAKQVADKVPPPR